MVFRYDSDGLRGGIMTFEYDLSRLREGIIMAFEHNSDEAEGGIKGFRYIDAFIDHGTRLLAYILGSNGYKAFRLALALSYIV